MSFFDLFRAKPEEREARRIRDLSKKSQERYGDPASRSRALEGLRDIGTPEALAALLQRFTVRAEPSITDGEEKDYTFSLITSFGRDAIEPIVDFIRRSDSVAWALRCLDEIVPEDELVEILTGLLARFAQEYARDPEKKIVLVNRLASSADPRIAPAILPLLEDPSDEVRTATLANLVAQKDADAAGPIARCLLSAESPRVRAASAEALIELGAPFASQLEEGELQELIEKLPDGFHLDKAGKLSKK